MPESHSKLSREYFQSTASIEYSTIKNFPVNAVDESTSPHIFSDVRGAASADYSLLNAPVAEVLQDIEEIVELSEFIAMNSTAPYDVDPTRTELVDSFLQSLFDEGRNPTARFNEGSQE